MEKRDKQKPLRIVVYAPLGVGGVTNLMLAIQKNLDPEKLVFDYLVVHDRKEPMEDTITSLGSKKIVASADNISFRPIRGILRLFIIRRVCKEHNIKILHFNSGAAMNVLTVIAAKLGGVKHVTFHSHNGGMANEGSFAKPISWLCKPIMPLFIDSFWACSKLAAEFSFPRRVVENNRYLFVPNGIELEKFRYNSDLRNSVRSELGVNGKFVIGNVGRFSFQKNHTFLVDVFRRVKEVKENAVLILFGEGPELENVKRKVANLELSDAVIFYGTTNYMNKMYQAIDVLVMPSLFEGFPVTGVEAQASGLPCIFSDTITKELAIGDNVKYVSLNSPIDIWRDAVLSYENCERVSSSNIEKLRLAGFDQKKMVEDFQAFYISVGKKLGLYNGE